MPQSNFSDVSYLALDLQPNLKAIILGYQLPFLPDFLSDTTLIGQTKREKIAEVLERFWRLIVGLRKYQSTAYALRYIFYPESETIQLFALARILNTSGQAEKLIQTVAKDYFDLLRDCGFSPISLTANETDNLLSLQWVCNPFENEKVSFCEIRQMEEIVSIRSNTDNLQTAYLIHPYTGPGDSGGSTFLEPFKNILRQSVPVAISIFLQPTEVTQQELDSINAAAQLAQTLADLNISPTTIGLKNNKTYDPVLENIGNEYLTYRKSLVEPVLSVVQIASTDADVAFNLARSFSSAAIYSNQQINTIGQEISPQGGIIVPRSVHENEDVKWSFETLTLRPWGESRATPGKERFPYLMGAKAASTFFRFPINLQGELPFAISQGRTLLKPQDNITNDPSAIPDLTDETSYLITSDNDPLSTNNYPLNTIAGFTNDATTTGDDQIGIMRDVIAFSYIFSVKEIDPPLCLGLFGDWGSGKSFFMRNMREQINALAAQARLARLNQNNSDFCSNIVQIEFNAWHYVDSNLWASLSNHIFNSLDIYLDTQQKDAIRNQLFSSLDVAQQVRAEASRALEIAQKAREDAEKHLQQVSIATYSAETLLGEAFETLKNTDEVKHAQADAEKIAKELGLSEIMKNLEDGRMILREMRTFGGRFYAAFIWLSGGSKWERFRRILLLTVMLIVLPLLPVLLKILVEAVSQGKIQLDAFTSLIAQVTTVLAGSIAWLSNISRKVSDELQRFEQAQMKVETVLANIDSQANQKIHILEKNAEILRSREQVARQILLESERRFEDAQIALEQVNTTFTVQSLTAFIHSQAISEAISNKLGLISMMRQNLETLSQQLELQRENNQPHVDRIILYIDDLDRCPEDKVVEVLQAVHLLLAFKIFIVVVGVDSRWLLHSLEKYYPALQNSLDMRFGWTDEESQGWVSTPQSYLEKIFQIPYHIRTMDNSGFKNLIDSLLPARFIMNVADKSNLEIANLASLNLSPDTIGVPSDSIDNEHTNMKAGEDSLKYENDLFSMPTSDPVHTPIDISRPLVANFLKITSDEHSFIHNSSDLTV